jgi:hypothetical protein
MPVHVQSIIIPAAAADEAAEPDEQEMQGFRPCFFV